jgi:signal transduction histidine kinase
LGETGQQALKEMRLMVYEMRPLALQQEGLVGALQRRLDAVEKRAGIQAQLLLPENLNLPPSLDEELYRITQEALNNSLKHAAARQVTVRVNQTRERVELEVVDDGNGFDLESIAGLGGMGISSMRERAARLGGSLIIQSTPGRGTRIKVGVTANGKNHSGSRG